MSRTEQEGGGSLKLTWAAEETALNRFTRQFKEGLFGVLYIMSKEKSTVSIPHLGTPVSSSIILTTTQHDQKANRVRTLLLMVIKVLQMLAFAFPYNTVGLFLLFWPWHPLTPDAVRWMICSWILAFPGGPAPNGSG